MLESENDHFISDKKKKTKKKKNYRHKMKSRDHGELIVAKKLFCSNDDDFNRC